MRYLILLIFLLTCLNHFGQTIDGHDDGTVSYSTSQNVYVKFASTKNVTPGDTLFINTSGKLVPALVVTNISSISAVCRPIGDLKFNLQDKVVAKIKPDQISVNEKLELPSEPRVQEDIARADTVINDKAKPLEQKITGRFGISSNANFSNTPGGNSLRMRYTFSLNAANINNSKLSAETYLSFVHRSDRWEDVKSDIFNGLKIYALALNYRFSDKSQLWFGRKINPKLSNVGAIDGLQYELKLKRFTVGAVLGSRPDYKNYSFNFSLVQFGGYLSYDYTTDKGNMQTTFAIMEQKNSGLTDRRFAYLQHSNTLFRNAYFFGSVEIDLYKKVNEVQSNTFNVSGLYLSVRYKIIKPLSVSVSYSNRQNVIYYETYKDIVDRLLDADATQGYMVMVSYRALKNVFLGVRGGYRFRKQDPHPTKNLYTYVTWSRVPWLKLSTTASATLLETAYMTGRIYSIGFNREIVRGKLDGGLNYRNVKYNFLGSENTSIQNMAELNLTWRIMKKLYCSFNFEGTFEKDYQYQRVYVNITQRF
ncbi:MAG: hypothetical protein Q8O72_08665 [Bacteroidales bacterium]|jgi:hypothetical protein|nr:hypothetical protein [Bacteroidales bacterium]